MIYLATPYIHEDKKIMDSRVLNVTCCAAHFMDKGEKIYSPITHGHAVNQHMKQMAGDHKYWLDQCYHHVVTAEAIYVLGLEGWKESKGVRWEVETGKAFNIPVFIVNPDTYELQELKAYSWKVEEGLTSD